MTCERLEVPGMQTVIVCRERRKGYKVARCQFCGSKAAVECDWKCDRFQSAHYRDIRVGDIVRRFDSVRDARPSADVIAIEHGLRALFVAARDSLEGNPNRPHKGTGA